MHDFLTEWFFLSTIIVLAAISPGPDLVMAIRNSVLYSRRAGIFTALGFGLGIAVHVTYCIIGIATVISQSILLFSLIKYAGAAYLLYIGVQALRSKGMSSDVNMDSTGPRSMTALQALRSGFITNLLNPKATLFFLALFTQIIAPQTPVMVQIVYGLTAIGIITTWFSIVAIAMTNPLIRQRFLGVSKWFDRVCGAALVGLGVRLALAKHS